MLLPKAAVSPLLQGVGELANRRFVSSRLLAGQIVKQLATFTIQANKLFKQQTTNNQQPTTNFRVIPRIKFVG